MSITYQKQKRRTGRRFISPTVLVLVMVVALPLAYSFVLSFFRYTFIKPGLNEFAGFENFRFAFENTYFWNSLLVTIKFVVIVVSLEFIVGYAIALLMNRDIKFKMVFYIVLTIPMVMSPVAVALIWKMLLHPDLGIVNYLLERVGLPTPNWFGDTRMALISLVFVDVWHQVSFMILMILAGLVSLPREPFESATIDGANFLQILRYITTPMLSPVISVAILMRTIIAFRTYDLIYVLTGGGPGTSTDIISYFIYRTTFMGLDLSRAAAISFFLLLIVMLMVIALFRQMRKDPK